MKRLKSAITLLFLLFSTITLWSCIGSLSSQKYTLFTNGAIYIDADSKVDNLLIKDDVVVGFNVNANEYRYAEIVDLKGATL